MLKTLKASWSSLGKRTTELAERVGPRRGMIAGGIIAFALGASFIVRHFKQRAPNPEPQNEHGGAPTKKQRRKARHHVHAASAASG